ncbi:DNA-binding LacI/PurR family transcriptional regulator [Kibdelosporangium banguiense]|uniref:DNA-binding LacI/PurR family transcriptional regulator n=1 Tax=Kibdelosporangium banguiense TaxID=1365924 RepID=A0ABS4TY88_9PSEU|nr:LacI family DNA-binding transcriptional regulator [Kibdelosporangium banguiense]MBP2328925.1 DNA-binding LacI/PurR family transcriptional regulator [Kibdelosporangium banguiense]
MTEPEDVGGRATTVDVARAAGVSRATVSHILNGRVAKFPEETRLRVHAAARELGYTPSIAGRALVNGRTDTVIVVLPNITIGFRMQEALDYVADHVKQLGASVLIRFAGRDSKSTLEAILYLRPLAVLDFGGLTGEDREAMERADVLVVPSTQTAQHGKGPLLDQRIGEVQVSALLASGPRQIVYVGLDDERDRAQIDLNRQAGVTLACQKRGLPAPSGVTIQLSVDEAAQTLRPLFGTLPVGVACYNDDVATAVLAACRKMGLRVPEDVSIVGVDHTPLGQLLDPPLTTVAVDVAREVEQTIGEMTSRVTDVPWIPQSVEGAATLVPGGTT